MGDLNLDSLGRMRRQWREGIGKAPKDSRDKG
jgi:hypothetical protein